MPDNIAAAALDEAFCEGIAVQSIVESNPIESRLISRLISCVDRLRTFYTVSTLSVAGRRRARRDENSIAPLLGAPVEWLVRPHLFHAAIFFNTRGCSAAILMSVFAAALGSRRPCSQSWRVRTDTPSSAANWA